MKFKKKIFEYYACQKAEKYIFKSLINLKNKYKYKCYSMCMSLCMSQHISMHICAFSLGLI